MVVYVDGKLAKVVVGNKNVYMIQLKKDQYVDYWVVNDKQMFELDIKESGSYYCYISMEGNPFVVKV